MIPHAIKKASISAAILVATAMSWGIGANATGPAGLSDPSSPVNTAGGANANIDASDKLREGAGNKAGVKGAQRGKPTPSGLAGGLAASSTIDTEAAVNVTPKLELSTGVRSTAKATATTATP